MARLSVLALVLLACVACGGESTLSGEDVPATVTGDVVEVRPTDGDVESFVVEQDGSRYEILIADDVEYGFDLAHLREHMTAGDPVQVAIEQRSDGAMALSIEDV